VHLQTILSDTLHLFYPHTCTGCGSDLLNKDNLLCLQCINNLPATNFAIHAGNPIEKTFWGRIPIAAAHSQYYFSKSSLVQQLMHQLKYKGNTAIGNYLGELMGKAILQSNRFANIDALVPLPLYPDKERKRGYNQAAVICKGMADVMQLPVINNNVIRRRPTETQTRKHRTERWQNVEDSFMVTNPAALSGKNILLVDDVITTGATIEACGSAILQCNDTTIFVASIAYTSK
jgi:ComF family protein